MPAGGRCGQVDYESVENRERLAILKIVVSEVRFENQLKRDTT